MGADHRPLTSVVEHYETASTLDLVTTELDRLAPDGRVLPLDELGGFDHFHTAGAFATERMVELLAPARTDVVLDAGCGLGGPARHLADRVGCRIIGVDLTPTFVEVGRLLNRRTGLDALVDLRVGDVTALDLSDASVDHAWTQHVAMNVADRAGFYGEIRRVVRTGGRFVSFDVVDGGGGELLLPVPWATEPHQSHLVTREEQRRLLTDAGFRVEADDDPAEEVLPAMRAMLAETPTHGLTMARFIDDVETKGPMYLRNLAEGRTALSRVVCTAV